MTARAWLGLACGVVFLHAGGYRHAPDFAVVTSAPPAASGLTVAAITNSTMNVSWTGSSPEFRAIYKSGSVPAGPGDGTLVSEGVSTSATVSGLSAATRYFIAVYGKSSGSATYSTSAVTTSVITLDGSLVDTGGSAGQNRQPNTAQGQLLYGDDPIYLFNGTSVINVQTLPSPTEHIEPTVFSLGSGSSPGHVIGAWRRGSTHAWVSLDGATPFLVNATNPIDAATPMNPEGLAVADGCVFFNMQAQDASAHQVTNVFLVDLNTHNATNLTGNADVPGTTGVRIRTQGCKATWPFDDNSGSWKIQYYPGTGASAQTIDSVPKSATFNIGEPWIGQGRIVYTKLVGGVPQVFLYDTTAASPAPVQLTNYADATMNLQSVQTDGRHVVWYRSKLDGTNPEIDLSGGVQLAAGNGAIFPFELKFELNRGQILWKDSAGGWHYETPSSSSKLTLPATTSNPWLSDGYIAYGDTAATGAFRFTGTPPIDAQQPSAPMFVKATPGTNSVTLNWDAVLGASSYDIYYANRPGVTKANYASLPGGTRLTGLTSSSFTVTGLTANAAYYFVVTTVDPSGEGPESRPASTVLLGTPSWVQAGSIPTTSIYAVAADRTNFNTAYATSGSNVYRSTDGGSTWTALAGGIAGINIRGLAADSGTVFATSPAGSIYKSANSGAAWSPVLSASGVGEQTQSIAIDPAVPGTIVAGDFQLPSFNGVFNDSYVIRSDDGGSSWFHTPQFGAGTEVPGDVRAYSLAFDPSHTSTLFACGNGTPNVARSLAGGAGWFDVSPGAGSGAFYTVAVDPGNPQTIYAGTTQAFGAFAPGVWKSTNGGAAWTQINTGLPANTAVHAIVIDPADSHVLHLGTESGYYVSTNAGTSWTIGNSGLPDASAQSIMSLAMTGSHQLLAGTAGGLYRLNLNVAPAPSVSVVTPNTGNIAGGTAVTISGANFQSGATVTFGGVGATGIVFVSSTTLTANTPAHAAGAVDVAVHNPDGQSGTKASGFTYSTSLAAPANVAAAASASQIDIAWNAVAGATGYEVYRRSPTSGGVFVLINSPAGNAYTDMDVLGATSYLYRVRAVNATTSSVDSAADIATVMIFTDDPIASGSTIVKAVHLTELRNAANAVRSLAGQSATAFSTGGSAGTTITAAQINEVRTSLDGGLSVLGLTTGGYTDTLTAGVPIKAVHCQEIRNRVK